MRIFQRTNTRMLFHTFFCWHTGVQLVADLFDDDIKPLNIVCRIWKKINLDSRQSRDQQHSLLPVIIILFRSDMSWQSLTEWSVSLSNDSPPAGEGGSGDAHRGCVPSVLTAGAAGRRSRKPRITLILTRLARSVSGVEWEKREKGERGGSEEVPCSCLYSC